jgi:3-oxoacyl-[acyl-carrier-protein] synthase-3
MSLSKLAGVRVAGISTCVPRRVLDNVLDCPPSLRSERERLVRNIGIKRRRISHEWQCFSDLAQIAAERLLEDLKWDRSGIDALIVLTQSPDYPIPATAILLQDRLGLSHGTLAYDINLGCSSYPFGLNLLGSMVASGAIRKALMLVGDKCATVRDPLFSDAGTATAIEFSRDAAPIYFDLNSDGSGYKSIILPVGGHREPFSHAHCYGQKDENGQWHWPADLILDGPAVLSFSTQRVPPAVERLLAYSGYESDDIDYFVFHQANKMINETIRKKLRLPADRVPTTLEDFGNTSGASLPVTISARLRESLAVGKRRLLLSGFGVGLSWGSCILDLENIVLPEIIEA